MRGLYRSTLMREGFISGEYLEYNSHQKSKEVEPYSCHNYLFNASALGRFANLQETQTHTLIERICERPY